MRLDGQCKQEEGSSGCAGRRYEYGRREGRCKAAESTDWDGARVRPSLRNFSRPCQKTSGRASAAESASAAIRQKPPRLALDKPLSFIRAYALARRINLGLVLVCCTLVLAATRM